MDESIKHEGNLSGAIDNKTDTWKVENFNLFTYIQCGPSMTP